MRLIPALVAALILAVARAAFADIPALKKRLAELEQQLAGVQKDLQEVRQQLDAAKAPPVLTPQQAVEAFQKDPTRPITIEMKVESISWIGSYPKNQVPINFRVTADAQLKDAIFCVDVDGLRNIARLAINHPVDAKPPNPPVRIPEPGHDAQKPLMDLKGKTIRASGLLRYTAGKDRPEGGANYYILTVDGIEDITIVK